MGKGWAESLPAAGGPEVARPPGQGAEGLTSQSFSRSCRLPFGLPPRCLRAWGWQPGGTVYSASGTSRSTASAQGCPGPGCPDNKEGSLKAWSCVGAQ